MHTTIFNLYFSDTRIVGRLFTVFCDLFACVLCPFVNWVILYSYWFKRRCLYKSTRTSLVAQMVKRLPAMRETWVQSLGREDLEKEMATHSNILAWKIPWMEEPGGLQSMGWQRVRHDWATSLSLLYVKGISPWFPYIYKCKYISQS